MTPAPRILAVFAAGLLLAALPALVSPALWPLWLAFVGLVMVAGGVDAVLCPRAGDLDLQHAVPNSLPMADGGVATLWLSLPLARPVPAELTVDLSKTLVPAGKLAGSLSREGGRFEVPLVPRRRGPAEVERAWVRFTGPLGLVARTVCRPLEHALTVVPSLRAVHSAALQFSNPRETLAGLKIEHFTGDGSQFESLREYQPGFDHRSIDWKASARHTKLLSRELRAERNHQVVLALDTGRLMAEPVGGVPRLDHAIHAALLLAFVSLKNGDRVSLFAFDEKPGRYTEPRGGVHCLAPLIRLAGQLRYSPSETNYTLGLTELASRLRRRSLVVVMTELVDTVTAELMVENVLRLARRHLVVFVALKDPLLDRLADSAPGSLEDIQRATVAEALLAEREVVLKRLARRGVTTIDAPPKAVGSRLLNRYLSLKRRERI